MAVVVTTDYISVNELQLNRMLGETATSAGWKSPLQFLHPVFSLTASPGTE